jgi:hypothetical protein
MISSISSASPPAIATTNIDDLCEAESDIEYARQDIEDTRQSVEDGEFIPQKRMKPEAVKSLSERFKAKRANALPEHERKRG